jgi:hypothetical protein
VHWHATIPWSVSADFAKGFDYSLHSHTAVPPVQ